MAVSVAVIVANIYYIQPLLGEIAHAFGLTVARAGSIAMLSQIGTALGMLFFVPLGDKFERRSLILFLLIAACIALVLMALAPNAVCLALAAFFVGAFSANVHVVVPFAAHLATPAQRGRVVWHCRGGHSARCAAGADLQRLHRRMARLAGRLWAGRRGDAHSRRRGAMAASHEPCGGRPSRGRIS